MRAGVRVRVLARASGRALRKPATAVLPMPCLAPWRAPTQRQPGPCCARCGAGIGTFYPLSCMLATLAKLQCRAALRHQVSKPVNTCNLPAQASARSTRFSTRWPRRPSRPWPMRPSAGRRVRARASVCMLCVRACVCARTGEGACVHVAAHHAAHAVASHSHVLAVLAVTDG